MAECCARCTGTARSRRRGARLGPEIWIGLLALLWYAWLPVTAPAAMRRSSLVARCGRKLQRRVVHADTRPLALWHRGIAAWLFITRQANESPTASGFVALCYRGILKTVAAVFAPASAVEVRNALRDFHPRAGRQAPVTPPSLRRAGLDTSSMLVTVSSWRAGVEPACHTVKRAFPVTCVSFHAAASMKAPGPFTRVVVGAFIRAGCCHATSMVTGADLRLVRG